VVLEDFSQNLNIVVVEGLIRVNVIWPVQLII